MAGWGAPMYAEAPPPGVSPQPPAMYPMPAMGVPSNGPMYPPMYPPWGASPAPQGAAWAVPLQPQQGNFHMMPQQGNFHMMPSLETGSGPREPEREGVLRRGPDGSRNSDDMVQSAETAARQAYEELVREQKHISVTKLVQRTLSALGVSSFEMLGFRMQDVPCLRNLALVEGKVSLSIVTSDFLNS